MEHERTQTSMRPGIIYVVCGVIGVVASLVAMDAVGATRERWVLFGGMVLMTVWGLGLLMSAVRERRRAR